MQKAKQPEKQQELWAESKNLDQDNDSPARKSRTARINSDNWKGGQVRRIAMSIRLPCAVRLLCADIEQRTCNLTITTILQTGIAHIYQMKEATQRVTAEVHPASK